MWRQMNNRKLYFITLGVVVLSLCINIVIMANMQRVVPYAEIIPNDESFTTIAPVSNDMPEQSLPDIYNLPPEISHLQTLKLQNFLDQFGFGNNFTQRLDSYYREGSLRTDSGNTSVLIDIPSIKQTLLVVATPNDTLDIACAPPAEQKESSWSCIDDLLGESE